MLETVAGFEAEKLGLGAEQSLSVMREARLREKLTGGLTSKTGPMTMVRSSVKLHLKSGFPLDF